VSSHTFAQRQTAILLQLQIGVAKKPMHSKVTENAAVPFYRTASSIASIRTTWLAWSTLYASTILVSYARIAIQSETALPDKLSVLEIPPLGSCVCLLLLAQSEAFETECQQVIHCAVESCVCQAMLFCA
jgi:hypothetical protein